MLIIEDDVDFVEGAENFVPAEDWAIFYGGYYADDPRNLHDSDIVGAHMMGFSGAIVPVVADYLRSISFDGIHPPIDGAYVWFRRAHPEVSALFARPPLGYQRPSVLRQIACFQTGCCSGAFGKKINQEHLSSKPRKLTVRAHPSFTHAQNSTLRQGSCGLSTFSAEILILQSSQESGPA